ncbi:MAG: Type 1 glutamine amidotransferase-like domain-containing protein [Anaerolineae bacterium]|nr:Type 1 glutamine amidotransferase-like domain-containing protein [Anaerolineae bacterium]
MLRKLLLCLLLASVFLTPAAAQDQPRTQGTLIPIGGGYETLRGFVESAFPYWQTLNADQFTILMLPSAFSYDPYSLSSAELLDNSYLADLRRHQLEEVCREVLGLHNIEGMPCRVTVLPVYTREAAQSDLLTQFFSDDPAAIYFLGGDQLNAMNIIANTPLEQAIITAFQNGVPLGGNSAGAALLAEQMIVGYAPDRDANTGLHEDAIQLWNQPSAGERGLAVGIDNALIETHLWELARTPRVLNLLTLEGAPHVVIGLDGATGGVLQDETVFRDVFGQYSAAIFDGVSLNASANAAFGASGVLSIHNVLVHLLAPGDFAFNLSTLQPSWANRLENVTRDFSAFAKPENAGDLYLYGSAPDSSSFPDTPETLVVLVGYPDEVQLAAASEYYDGQRQIVSLTAGDLFETSLPEGASLNNYNFIAVIGSDPSLISISQLQPIAEVWRNGTTLLMGGAAAAAAGQTYAANSAVNFATASASAIALHAQGSFIVGGTRLRPGLELVDLNVEPHLIDNNRFGRLFSLAFNEKDVQTLGLPENTAVRFTAEGAFVQGENAAFVLDLSDALLGVGVNNAFVVANALLDTFAANERIQAVGT